MNKIKDFLFDAGVLVVYAFDSALFYITNLIDSSITPEEIEYPEEDDDQEW